MEDKKIIKLLFQRAEQALDLLAARFGPRLLLTARNILSDHQDAEECVSDTYLAIWNAIPPREPDPLAGFVYKTGRNLAMILEVAAMNNRQKKMGYNAAVEFTEQINRHFEENIG